MIDPKMIPDEVIEAAKEAYRHTDEKTMSDWLAEIIAAGLNAWPGMEYWPEFSDAGLGEHEPGKVFLPLTQEVK